MKKLLPVLILCCFLLPAFAQKLQFRNYNVRDGLSQSQVYDMTEDYRGRLWMATRGGGVSVFNGLTFRTISQKDGLSNDFVYCFYQDTARNMWIGTNDGLNVFDGKSIRKYYPGTPGGQVWIMKVAGGRDGRLWIASRTGLLLFANGKFRNISDEQRLLRRVCNTVFLDQDGMLYFGNDIGLFRLNTRDSALKVSKVIYGATNPDIAITSLMRSSREGLIAASYGYGLFRVEKGRLLRYLEDAAGRTEKVLDLLEDRQTLYIATLENGVLAYNYLNRKIEPINEQKGLAGNHVRKVYKDRGGRLWFGTSGGGASNFGGQLFTHFDKASGLPDKFVYAVLQSSDHKVWIGSGINGLSVMESDSIRVYNAHNGFINAKVKAIRQYDEDHILIGTEGNGLYIWQKGIFRYVASLGRQFIKDISVDQDGNIWLATAGNGIYRLKPQDLGSARFEIRQFVDHIINPRVQFLNTQQRGRVFYCTENEGIGMIEQEQESDLRLNTRTGLLSNLTRSMVIGPGGIAWIATSDHGLSAYDLVSRKPVPVDNSQLPSLNIYLLRMDRRGNLVLGTEKGLDYVVLDRLHHISSVKHYGRGDGFLGIETCLNAVSENPDGSFWIGTIDGLSLFNPAKSTTNAIPPLLSLTGIRLFYQPIGRTRFAEQMKGTKTFDPLSLPYNQNHLSFDFEGVNLNNGEGVLYKWKLEGFDAVWSPASAQQSVTYSNIPPGSYTLLLNACNEDGVWSKTPFRYSFEIKKPFWMAWWFAGCCLLLLVWLIYKVVQWRTRRIRREAAEKQRELQLANQLQSLEHKALRLQMNPHFIFNALNSIQSQVGNGNDREARYYIAKFGKLMRQILNHSEHAWVHLAEELEMIENYLLIEQFCHNRQFRYELQVDAQLREEEYKIPSMIIQPFVENAIKHGFRNLKDREAVLKLDIYPDGKNIICIIADNGVGRPREAMRASAEQHASMALQITRKRLQLLHGDMLRQFVEIEDLRENGQSAGTLVRVILPLQ